MNTHWEATQRVMAAELTRLTHKIAMRYRLQFSLQAASPETFGYTLVRYSWVAQCLSPETVLVYRVFWSGTIGVRNVILQNFSALCGEAVGALRHPSTHPIEHRSFANTSTQWLITQTQRVTLGVFRRCYPVLRDRLTFPSLFYLP